ncbi:hypothetical protein NQT72_15540 [Pseudoalteromonas carrageenovora]|uniref:GapS1 family protein n=1 Tax=Pseudoalteromonas carrageenovora TaxID=227 RepID=UPI002118E695|nr:hypothetical protein [Pseudoalteromonas carrageenovora]MCQ8890907.1 hypothetical protein [Pseudoalteromonas carrageenovora]
MSFSSKADLIRKKLRKFTKHSIINEEIKRLSKPVTESYHEAQKMPWLSFLLMEWLYQVEEFPHAVNATSKDVYNILNSMYQLQDDASNFKDGVSLNLALRRMLLGQLWCQLNPLYHQFTLIRLYSLTIIKGKTPYFEKTFKKFTGIELFDFFQFALWLSFASVQQKGIIKFEQLIKDFYPKYSVEYIARLITLISGGPNKMTQVMGSIATPNISSERYFAQPKLLDVPFFRFENRLGSLHNSVSCKGLAEFVLNTFKVKEHEKFRRHFAKHFEEYVGIILDESGYPYRNEKGLEKIYKANAKSGKVIDYLLEKDGSTVFVDAKAIEPPEKVMVTDDAEIIRQRLKKSFTKGIEQSFECANILVECEDVKLADYQNRFVIVVTHQDFYLSNGLSVQAYIAKDFFQELAHTYGDHIPIENVHFCAVEDFEGIMFMCKEHGVELSEFLLYCTVQDSDAITKKFDIRQHLQSFLQSKDIEKNSPIGTDYLSKRKDELFDALTDTLKTNNEYWKENGATAIPEYLEKYYKFCKLMN